ncbi:hypothetical protein [Kordiimonas sp.]|uniref:FliH/SctL family protein n=1 Tax=Kordiimonas sp. TaxID=1970157 RepID=UPI003A8FF470
MAEPVKYKFDTAFDGGAKSRFDEELDRVRLDADRIKTEAYQTGLEEGRRQALSEIEAATKDALGELEQATRALFSQRNQLESTLKQEMVQLAYAISSKLAPALIRTHPMAEIEAFIEDCLATMQKEPRLVVRVCEDLVDSINERIENLKAATGFPGDIVLIGEETMGMQDCKVEWPDGGSDRNHATIVRQIEDAVQRFVMPDEVEALNAAKAPDDTETTTQDTTEG